MTDSLFKQYEGVFAGKNDLPNKKEGFEYAYSPFALQDAIGEKNVKKIWIEYQKLILAGIEAEDIIHKITAKVRDMLAIKKGASREDLGLKSDFPYNKSKKDSRNWQPGELGDLYRKLVFCYHASRMSLPGGGRSEELETSLERAILGI